MNIKEEFQAVATKDTYTAEFVTLLGAELDIKLADKKKTSKRIIEDLTDKIAKAKRSADLGKSTDLELLVKYVKTNAKYMQTPSERQQCIVGAMDIVLPYRQDTGVEDIIKGIQETIDAKKAEIKDFEASIKAAKELLA